MALSSECCAGKAVILGSNPGFIHCLRFKLLCSDLMVSAQSRMTRIETHDIKFGSALDLEKNPSLSIKTSF